MRFGGENAQSVPIESSSGSESNSNDCWFPSVDENGGANNNTTFPPFPPSISNDSFHNAASALRLIGRDSDFNGAAENDVTIKEEFPTATYSYGQTEALQFGQEDSIDSIGTNESYYENKPDVVCDQGFDLGDQRRINNGMKRMEENDIGYNDVEIRAVYNDEDIETIKTIVRRNPEAINYLVPFVFGNNPSISQEKYQQIAHLAMTTAMKNGFKKSMVNIDLHDPFENRYSRRTYETGYTSYAHAQQQFYGFQYNRSSHYHHHVMQTAPGNTSTLYNPIPKHRPLKTKIFTHGMSPYSGHRSQYTYHGRHRSAKYREYKNDSTFTDKNFSWAAASLSSIIQKQAAENPELDASDSETGQAILSTAKTAPQAIPIREPFESGYITPPTTRRASNDSTSSSFSLSPPARTKPIYNPFNHKYEMECVFCKSNNQPEEIYKTHLIRDPATSEVICPYLKNHLCMICKTTGHTIKYCPINKRGFFAYRQAAEAKRKLAIQMSRLREAQAKSCTELVNEEQDPSEPFRLTFNSITNTFEPPPRPYGESQGQKSGNSKTSRMKQLQNSSYTATTAIDYGYQQQACYTGTMDQYPAEVQHGHEGYYTSGYQENYNYTLSDPRWGLPTMVDGFPMRGETIEPKPMTMDYINSLDKNMDENEKDATREVGEEFTESSTQNEADALLNRILNLDFSADQLETS